MFVFKTEAVKNKHGRFVIERPYSLKEKRREDKITKEALRPATYTASCQEDRHRKCFFDCKFTNFAENSKI